MGIKNPRSSRQCSNCGGPVATTTKSGVCRRNPDCKRVSESRHNFNGARRRKSYTPCAKCGNDWLRGNRAEKLCGLCRDVSFWCSGYLRTRGNGHVADVAVRVARNACRGCRLLRFAASRAQAKGVPYALTWPYVESIWPSACPYLGIPLKHGAGRPEHASPTLDRIVPGLGYVEGNVEVVSHLANAMKRDATTGQLIRFAQVVLARYAVGVEATGLAGLPDKKEMPL
jgi:hypothetical protein